MITKTELKEVSVIVLDVLWQMTKGVINGVNDLVCTVISSDDNSYAHKSEERVNTNDRISNHLYYTDVYKVEEILNSKCVTVRELLNVTRSELSEMSDYDQLFIEKQQNKFRN